MAVSKEEEEEGVTGTAVRRSEKSCWRTPQKNDLPAPARQTRPLRIRSKARDLRTQRRPSHRPRCLLDRVRIEAMAVSKEEEEEGVTGTAVRRSEKPARQTRPLRIRSKARDLRTQRRPSHRPRRRLPQLPRRRRRRTGRRSRSPPPTRKLAATDIDYFSRSRGGLLGGGAVEGKGPSDAAPPIAPTPPPASSAPAPPPPPPTPPFMTLTGRRSRSPPPTRKLAATDIDYFSRSRGGLAHRTDPAAGFLSSRAAAAAANATHGDRHRHKHASSSAPLS
jgi:hypothetical protein